MIDGEMARAHATQIIQECDSALFYLDELATPIKPAEPYESLVKIVTSIRQEAEMITAI